MGTKYDAVVIGGGPSGSTVAARLAQRGRRVLLVEKEHFPRFHIGESMLPCSMPLFEQLGAMPALLERGFLPKYAAEFVTGDGRVRQRYAFADGMVPGAPSAFEVDRAEFDEVLLRNAARLGVEVREGTAVTRFDIGREGAELTLRDDQQVEARVSAQVLIDASGQSSFVAGKLGMREMDPGLKNFAVFSHFDGAERHTGDREGDISVVLVPGGWWWVIPLAGGRTSVGMVGPASMLRGRKPDEAYFSEQIAATPYLAKRLAKATRVAQVRTISDYSYVSKRLAGDRFVLVGDAGAFIDPVFSTGVYLGMTGAFKAAEAVDAALTAGRFSRREFVAYESWQLKQVDTYKKFVKGFYKPEFVELLMSPSNFFDLRAAITSLLAGFGVDRPEVNARVLVFLGLTKLNKRFSLVPRLNERLVAASGEQGP
ncbi:MAG TPA: NAD(P)/FAD-dependent oxidoreductase [Polyangiaceae bacterium]|nr:NAD(P)/FAD-dependent oxidoreductase [Polyangiaceae bacterium]